MAENVKRVELNAAEAAIVRKALEVYKVSIVRARDKEPVGSEMFDVRSRQVAAIDSLLQLKLAF